MERGALKAAPAYLKKEEGGNSKGSFSSAVMFVLTIVVNGHQVK